MSNDVSVHIFEPVVKAVGFDTFKCTKKKADCFNCKRYSRCPGRHGGGVGNVGNDRYRWLGVMMGPTPIGILTLDDEGMIRFKSKGNNRWGLNEGAKIGDIVDPKSYDKIGKRILKTAAKRVPLEIRDEMESMQRTYDWTINDLEGLYSTLESFIDDFRNTVEKWKGINRVGEKAGVPVDVEAVVNFENEEGDEDVQLTVKDPKQLIAFIEMFAKKKPVVQKIVDIFDKISEEVIE